MTTNTPPRVLRNRVRERRKALGLTQTDTATQAGISRQTLWSIEKNEGYPPEMPVALRLARTLDADVTWLFYEEQGPMTNTAARESGKGGGR